MADPKKTGPPGPLQWDTEERHELSEVEGHIRGWTMFLTAALWAAMKETLGNVMFVLTSTNTETGEVTLAKAESEHQEGAVKVRVIGTLNNAQFSWWRPLKKLKMQIPEDRQLNVTPYTKEVEGVGTVFVFPMTQAKSVPRNLNPNSKKQQAKKTTQAKPADSSGTAATAPETPTAKAGEAAAAE